MTYAVSFTNRHALVTGASSGIGAQVATDLGQSGATVFLVARDEKKLSELAGRVDRSVVVAGNVATKANCARIAEEVASHSKSLDHLVVSAGVFQTTPLEEATETEWEDILETNLSGAFWTIQQMRPLLKQGTGKSIVVVSSILAHFGGHGLNAYCASKGGLSALVKSLALELASDGIRINAVSPGHIDTALISDLMSDPATRETIEVLYPLRRIGQPRDVSALILFLLSHHASWITGCDYVIDGGRSATT